MTLALNKMASLLAALVVLGIMLLGSPAAHAHVSHDGKAVERSASVHAFAADGLDLYVSATETERSGPLADVLVSVDRFDDPHADVEDTCCGNGVTACSSGALALTQSLLLYPMPGAAESTFSYTALIGISVARLIRPPRASV